MIDMTGARQGRGVVEQEQNTSSRRRRGEGGKGILLSIIAPFASEQSIIIA